MKYNYKELGLSNTKEMFKKANENGYAALLNRLDSIEARLTALE